MYELKCLGVCKVFNGYEMPIINGGFGENQKCISDKAIADLHGMETRKVRERLINNIKRFTENVDIIDLKNMISENNELMMQIGYTRQMILQAEHIYLLSRRGYAKLIKIFDTDLAWDVYENLLDDYFNNNSIDEDDLSPYTKAMIDIERKVKYFEKKYNKHDEDINELKDTINDIRDGIFCDDYKRDFSQWVKIIVHCLSKKSDISERDIYEDTYEKLEEITNVDLIRERNILREAYMGSGFNTYQASGNATILSVIERDNYLRVVYEDILRKMIISFGVTNKDIRNRSKELYGKGKI